MRVASRVSLGLVVVLSLIGGEGAAEAQEPRFVTIGTGGVTEVYYAAGGAICRLVNAGRRDHGIRCSVETSGGSIDNIRALRAGEFDFGIVQSDVQHQARRGTGPFKGEPAFRRLRSVLSLHPEPLTILARADAGIATLRDLPGKRIGIGNPGSAPRITFGRLMSSLGWTRRSFAAALELPTAEQAAALLDGRLDAAAFVVAHPDSTLDGATRISDGALIEVTGRAVNRLVARTPFYAAAVIPGGTYRGTDEDVRTFGVRATLVTTAAVPAEVVYQVVRAVFEGLDDFRMLHPALGQLDAGEMARQALSARLHPGARRFYREAGLR